MKVIFSFSLFAALMLCVSTLHAQRVKADSVLTSIVRYDKNGGLSVETVSTDIDINEKRSEAFIVINEDAVSEYDSVEDGDAYVKALTEKFDSTAVKKTAKKKTEKKAVAPPVSKVSGWKPVTSKEELAALALVPPGLPMLEKHLGIEENSALAKFILDSCKVEKMCDWFYVADSCYACSNIRWYAREMKDNMILTHNGKPVFDLTGGLLVKEIPKDQKQVIIEKQSIGQPQNGEGPNWNFIAFAILIGLLAIALAIYLSRKKQTQI